MKCISGLLGATLLSAAALVPAPARAAGYAYFSNITGNTASIIDTATNTIAATPNVGTSSTNSALALPNGNFGYIGAGRLIHVFDTVDNSAVATIDGGAGTTFGRMAASPDSTRIYAVANSQNRIVVIDTATNNVLTSIGVTSPLAVATSLDGSRLFVASNTTGAVQAIDTATNTVLPGSASVPGVASLTVSPDGSKVYVTATTNQVYPVDATTLAVGAAFAAPSVPLSIAISADGGSLYVPGINAGSLSILRATDGVSLGTIATGSGAFGVALNRAGTRAYVGNTGANTVSVIDLTNNTVPATISVAGQPGAIGNFVTPELSLLTIATTDGGRIVAGAATGPQLTCTTGTCRRNYGDTLSTTVTAEPAAGYTFRSWGGDCTGTSAAVTLSMAAPRNCIAYFSAIPVPVILPGWYNSGTVPFNLAAPATLAGGFLSASVAAEFQNPSALTFTATAADGGPLPAGMAFDPATLRFTGTATLPGRPVQAATAATRNVVYPPSFAVGQIPVAVTATGADRSTITLNHLVEISTPRAPVAMTALSATIRGAGGNAPSTRPSLSHDGGQIAFQTTSGNLAPDGAADVLRYHAQSGRLDRLNQTAIPGGGVNAGTIGQATTPSVAADGGFAAFAAEGPGLVIALATNGVRQIYRIGLKYPRLGLDAATPGAELVSGTAGGVAGDGASDSPAISHDGRYVAFTSSAGNLTAGVGGRQVYLKDMQTGALTLVSGSTGGQPGNGISSEPAISWDGRRIAFTSTATNLAAGGNGQQIYLKDIDTGAVTLVSARGSVAGDGLSSGPRLSGDGTTIVFTTTAANLGAQGGGAYVATVQGNGPVVRGQGDQATVSGDGRFIAWRDPAGQIQVMDILRGATAPVSRSAAGAPGNAASAWPALSGDGMSLAFATDATNLVDGNLPAGQVILAGNPLVDPGAPRYWHVTSGDQQGWAIERSGGRAYVASLTYDAVGSATWQAGFCRLTGLACTGQLGQGGPAFTITFADDGIGGSLALPGTTLALRAFALGGTTAPALPGLPQAGWWFNADNPAGMTGWFLGTATPATGGRLDQSVAMLTGLVYDGTGRPFWAVAEAALTADGTRLGGTLNRYAGGAPLGVAPTAAPSAMPLGPITVTWTGPGTATAVLPDGSRINLARWLF